MSFSIAIIGLPNVGKSTLFKALTKKSVEIADYPFTTINPNIGVIAVPDKTLEKIAEIIKPKKITPTNIEFVDIAGLVKGAHKGEGLGNQFLSHIRNCDAILEIVRIFEKDTIRHVEKDISPERDIQIIKNELIMKDLETIEKQIIKLDKKCKTGDKKIIKKIEILNLLKNGLEKGKFINDQINQSSLEQNLTDKQLTEIIREFQFLTNKPILYLFNVSEQEIQSKPNYNEQKLKNLASPHPSLIIDLKLEEEISELSKSEAKELNLKANIDQLILSCYNILDLITFYTIAKGEEVRAWTLKKGSTAPEAGGVVHSDFEKNFIKAEVISSQKLISAKSWTKAKELGWIKIVGKDYIVKNSDVIEFKI